MRLSRDNIAAPNGQESMYAMNLSIAIRVTVVRFFNRLIGYFVDYCTADPEALTSAAVVDLGYLLGASVMRRMGAGRPLDVNAGRQICQRRKNRARRA